MSCVPPAPQPNAILPPPPPTGSKLLSAWLKQVQQALNANQFKVFDENKSQILAIGQLSPTTYGIELRRTDGALVIDRDRLAEGSITKDLFDVNIAPVERVTSLPSMPNEGYPQGMVVFLTTDSKLYRSLGTSWSKALDGADVLVNSLHGNRVIAGTISASHIASISISVLAAAVGVLSELTDDAGIIVNGKLVNVADTNFIDLGAAGSQPFIKTPGLEILANGTATFSGTVAATSFTGSGARFDLGLNWGAVSGSPYGGTLGTSSTGGSVRLTTIPGSFGHADWLVRNNDSVLTFELAAGHDAGLAESIRFNCLRMGFFKSTPAVKPTVTGSRDGNAALASLLTGLASLGLITDSST